MRAPDDLSPDRPDDLRGQRRWLPEVTWSYLRTYGMVEELVTRSGRWRVGA